MVSKGMGSGRRGGGARGRIDERNGVVCFSRILDVGIVRSKGLRVVLGTIVAILLLAFGLLFLVQLALILLVFRYAGLQGLS